MNAAIIGGKLQGLEACYLAKKAGWNTILIDKNIDIPAYNLCDVFLHLDIHNWKYNITDLKSIDVVIPALENRHVLNSIGEMSDHLGIPYIFDRQAYFLSCSKDRSYALLEKIGIPVPKKWPECGFPLIIKPDGQSGSKDVQIHTQQNQELSNLLVRENMIAEEYVTGPLYSLEVLGVPGNYESIQVTDLVLDTVLDCKRVIAPSMLDIQMAATFHDQAKKIAEAIQLHGIMDVESIFHKGQLIAIEIDARLPSQTPTAVYWSCNCNILERYVNILVNGRMTRREKLQYNYVIYEHIEIKNNCLSFCGEHCIAQRTQLTLIENFMGADEAITNVHVNPTDWVATVIFVGISSNELQRKRLRFYTNIIDAFSLYNVEEKDIYSYYENSTSIMYK